MSLSHRVLAHPHTPFCACCSVCLLLCVSYKAAGSVTSLTHVLLCSPVTLAPQTSSRSACGALILYFLLDRTVAVTAFTPHGGGNSEVRSSLESAWYILSAGNISSCCPHLPFYYFHHRHTTRALSHSIRSCTCGSPQLDWTS